MKQKHPYSYFLFMGVLLLLSLGATACEKKQDKAWQYFGEAGTETPKADKTAQAAP